MPDGLEWSWSSAPSAGERLQNTDGAGSLACCSPPAVWPSSKQAMGRYWPVAQGLGTPDVWDLKKAGRKNEKKSKIGLTTFNDELLSLVTFNG